MGHLATERPFHLSRTQDNSTLLERKNNNGRPMGVIERKKLLWRVLENEEESLEQHLINSSYFLYYPHLFFLEKTSLKFIIFFFSFRFSISSLSSSFLASSSNAFFPAV